MRQYLEEIKVLRENLSIEEYYRVFNVKLIDYLDKNKMDGATLLEFRKMVENLYYPEFRHFADDCFRQYNELIDLVNTVYAEFGYNVSRDLKKIKALELINTAQLGEFKEQSALEIARRVRKGLAEGYRANELARYLQPIDEKVKYYAHTIARTQASGYGQECKNEKARIAEVFLFQYVGPNLRLNSHAMCKCMFNVTCHIDDIQKMLNGVHLPVMTYKAGYRCVHLWEPDPTAEQKDEGTWQEGYLDKRGKRLVRVYSPRTLETRS